MIHSEVGGYAGRTFTLALAALCLGLVGPAAGARADTQALASPAPPVQTPAKPGAAAKATAAAESPLPAWDVTALLGWRGVRLIAQRDIDLVDYDHRLLGGALVGRHWTPHLKTELEIGGTAGSDVVSLVRTEFDVPGYLAPPYIVTIHRMRDTVFSVAGLYQFGDNAWFHPHVGAGVEVARTRDEATVPRQTIPADNPPRQVVIAEASHQVSTTVTTRPFLATGFKAYANERVFVRGDLRIVVGQAPTSVSARFGVGFDF